MAQDKGNSQGGAAPWLRRRGPALLVLVLGLGLSGALYGLAVRMERHKTDGRFLNHSRDLSVALSGALEAHVREIEAFARFYESSDEVTRAEFRTFVTPYVARDTGVQAVGWAPRVTLERRAEYEEAMRAEGLAGFQITQVGPRGGTVRRQEAAEYFPMTFLEPYLRTEPVVGFDLASDPVRDQALQGARASGQTEATGRIVLVLEEPGHCGFLLIHPVYDKGAPTGSEAERMEALTGFVVCAFRLDNVVQAAFNALRPLDINVLLRDASDPTGSGFLAYYSGRTKQAVPVESDPGSGARSTFHYESVVDVAGRRWELTFTPTPRFLAASRTWYPWALLAFSLVLSGMLALIHQRRVDEADRVDALVVERTTALEKANLMLTHEITRRREAQAALRDARDSLEQKVKERTAELLRANRSLTYAIEGKEKAQQELEQTNERLEAALAEVEQAQRRVVEQERMHALAQMASGIAHDFNNSLSQILGFAELLLSSPQDLADREKAARFLEFIHAAASHAAEVVRRMRAFYRPAEKDDTEMPVAVTQLVDEAVAATEPRWKDRARARGLDVQIRKDLDGVPPVAGSPRDLGEMLTNLLLNAVEAMQESGTVTVSARQHGGMVRLNVSDTGRGMTEEVASRCTEPFFSTKGADGSGLGLATVRGVVKRCGGTLSIDSEPGKGTVVTVELPVWRPKEVQATAACPAGGRPGLRVLLVDDDEMVGHVLEGFLRTDGHKVVTVRSAQQALTELGAKGFDVVITDRSMPDMSGDRLAVEVKERSPGQPVIMVTGFGDLMAQAGDRPAAVDLVVAKPVSMDGLRRAVAEVTAEK